MTTREAMKRACAKPDWRRKQSENKKALWADPEWAAKWKASRAKTKTGMDKHISWNNKMRALGVPFDERVKLIRQAETQQ